MLYRLFSSLKTSIFILSFMAVVFLIGTIFPQGGDIQEYIKAGGKYVPIVKALNFLNIFTSPLFIFATFILLINLAVCLYDRLKIFLKFKRKTIDFERLKNHLYVITFKKSDIEDQLKAIGFKFKKESLNTERPNVKMFEKGFQYWWLSWLYHIGIILAIFGFFLTALFAFEKDVVLYPDKPKTISLYNKETRWNQFLKNLGKELPEERNEGDYVLRLKEFRTEYYQGLKIDYPENIGDKLATGIGIKKIEQPKKGFSYMPKMWLSRLDVTKPDGEVLDAKLWVNKPFRTGGLTLYQMGYEQKVKLSVSPVRKKALPELSNGVRGKTLDVYVREPFEVKGIKGKFLLGTLKLGTLFKKDGSKEKIIPFTTVYYVSDENPYKTEALGDLRLGDSIYTKGVIFKFRDYEEASYLSYRKDPGVWLVGLACLFVFIGLFVRSLGAWYRVQYAVEDNTAYVLTSTRGILADKERIIKKLQK